ncbi:hypothetical protein NL676_004647 [Syzygium grande]|nr:hypothetical protein NL676_004647 [Syzygium grande]
MTIKSIPPQRCQSKNWGSITRLTVKRKVIGSYGLYLTTSCNHIPSIPSGTDDVTAFVTRWGIMASNSKLGHVVVVVTLCLLLLIAAASDCEAGRHGRLNAMAGSFLKKDSRKILRAFEKYGGSKIANGELRGVPSGPDPLHHHKGSPQRPQTP